MKSLFNGIICASLLAFAVGCGKDNKSGGSNNGLGIYNSGLTAAVSQDALAKVQQWFNSNVEGYPQYGLVNAQKVTKVYNTQPTCSQKSILGIPFNYCTFNGTPQTTSQALSLNIVQDGRPISQKGNAELNAIFSNQIGQLVSARDVSSTQTELTYLRGDGSLVVYGINRGRHSSLNPEYKSEQKEAQKIETIIQ